MASPWNFRIEPRFFLRVSTATSTSIYPHGWCGTSEGAGRQRGKTVSQSCPVWPRWLDMERKGKVCFWSSFEGISLENARSGWWLFHRPGLREVLSANTLVASTFTVRTAVSTQIIKVCWFMITFSLVFMKWDVPQIAVDIMKWAVHAFFFLLLLFFSV